MFQPTQFPCTAWCIAPDFLATDFGQWQIVPITVDRKLRYFGPNGRTMFATSIGSRLALEMYEHKQEAEQALAAAMASEMKGGAA